MDGSVRLWDLESGKTVESIDLGGLPIRSLRFSADGRRLAIGTTGSFAIQRVTAERRIAGRDTGAASSPTFALAFDEQTSPGAFITGHADGRVYLRRDFGPGDLIHSHVDQERLSRGCAARAAGCSPDHRWFFSVGDDGRLFVTDLTGREEKRCLIEHHGRIKSGTFSPDGRLLAIGAGETIHVWKTDTWSLAATLRGHRDEIWVLDFSPDGRFLASGSRDSTARVWDVSAGGLLSGHSIACLPCANAVVAVSFAADSKSLRVADAGPDRGIPNIQIAELRCVGRGGRERAK